MKRCIVFTVNERYLYQAIISATQARVLTPLGLADIVIVCIGSSGKVIDSAKYFCVEKSIILLSLKEDCIENGSLLDARLYLDRMLPENYEDIIYLDADTQVMGSLEPLFRVDFKCSSLLATHDVMSYLISNNTLEGKKWNYYFSSIGISRDNQLRYFNSGVLRFNRTFWSDVSKECLVLLRKKRDTLKFPDQDALNIILNGKHSSMSLSWNFPSFIMNTKIEEFVKPNLYHFCSNPRPWQGPYLPWGETYSRVYLDFAKSYPDISRSFAHHKGLIYLKYYLQVRVNRLKTNLLWNNASMVEKISESEEVCIV